MTIRLLAAYGIYPCNAIVTLDSPTEAGLIAAKQALADTTGGTPYVAPVLPEAIDETKSGSAGTDSNGNVLTPALSSHNLVTGKDEILPTIGGGKRQAIRTAIEAAARSNAFLLPPHSPAPTWAPTTLYIKGQIVRGAAVGSTNNLYMMFGSVPYGTGYGTSAGAGGPSGIGPALITDGGCCWEYIGAATSVGTYPLYSTVIPVTSTDVMNGYFAFADSANLTAMGLTNSKRISTTDPLGTLTNGPLTNAVTLRYKNTGSFAAPNRTASSAGKPCFRFLTNAKKWLALKPSGPLYQYSINLQAVKVNGQFLSECGSIPSFAATSSNIVRLFDLSRFPAGDKEIEIFIQDALTTVVYDTYLQPEEYIYQLEGANNFKIALEGDSIGDMTYGGSHTQYSRYEIMLQEMLGSKNAFNNCIGATSLISNNGGAKTNYLERLEDIILFEPDLLVVSGIHNDTTTTQQQTTDALAIYLNAVRTALPYCTICIQGGNLLSAESGQDAIEQKLLNAYNAWTGDKSNTLFVPILTGTYPLVAASATGYFFKGNNSPVGYTDGHPCWWYYKHIVPIVANAIRKFYRAS